eukprot:scaffold24427_cov55-Phaeocystis_antarctica.AAC.4
MASEDCFRGQGGAGRAQEASVQVRRTQGLFLTATAQGLKCVVALPNRQVFEAIGSSDQQLRRAQC